jgi:hypothetical protein
MFQRKSEAARRRLTAHSLGENEAAPERWLSAHQAAKPRRCRSHRLADSQSGNPARRRAERGLKEGIASGLSGTNKCCLRILSAISRAELLIEITLEDKTCARKAA